MQDCLMNSGSSENTVEVTLGDIKVMADKCDKSMFSLMTNLNQIHTKLSRNAGFLIPEPIIDSEQKSAAVGSLKEIFDTECNTYDKINMCQRCLEHLESLLSLNSSVVE